MLKILLCAALLMFTISTICNAQNADQQDIDRLFADLRQTLIKRTAPDAFLSPTLPAVRRQEEAQKALRPYVTLEFRYNLADLKQSGPNVAKLPLIMEWETANGSGKISASAQLEKVDNRWYFTNFDFMSFPWMFVVVVACSVAVAFASVVLYLYWRLYKRLKKSRQPVSARLA
jgi:hypothetical protein